MSSRSPIVPFAPLPKRSNGGLSAASAATPADFSDRESRRVLAAAARAVARELGRAAAREYFAEMIGKPKGRS